MTVPFVTLALPDEVGRPAMGKGPRPQTAFPSLITKLKAPNAVITFTSFTSFVRTLFILARWISYSGHKMQPWTVKYL